MGYTHVGVTLPQMTVEDIDEIINELFPNKVTLADPDDADEVIPEVTAFWQFLRRECQLANADAVLAFLYKAEPEFKGKMNDPANFGMAKSFFTAGLDAGFDMTTPEGMEAFRQHYNVKLPTSNAGRNHSPAPEGFADWTPGSFSTPTSTVDKAKKKRLRQQAKVARKKNRRRKKITCTGQFISSSGKTGT